MFPLSVQKIEIVGIFEFRILCKLLWQNKEGQTPVWGVEDWLLTLALRHPAVGWWHILLLPKP